MANMYEAQRNFYALCEALDEMGWKYEKDEENLLIRSGVRSDDLPVEFIVRVAPQNEVVQFLSSLSFRMPENKRVEGAVAVCIANYGLVDGSFDYDISDGEIRYRLTCSYRESVLTSAQLQYIIHCAATTVDEYNDRFFMIAKDMMTIEQFAAKENG